MTATMTASKAISLYNQSLDYLQGHGVAKDEQRAFALNAERRSRATPTRFS